MIDPRFYALTGPLPLSEEARIGGAALPEGVEPSVPISACAALFHAQSGDVAFCEQAPNQGQIETSATACFVRPEGTARLPDGVVALVTKTPRAAFSLVAAHLVKPHDFVAGDPLISPMAVLETDVAIMPGAAIAAGAEIGAGTVIGVNAIIGPGVAIGRDCVIGPGAVIRCALIGDRVKIGANSVIGEAGFGVAPSATGPVDVPQMGRVILQDDVSIGALSAVDRGAFGDTVIGLSSKIDNLVQIAHNVVLGRGVVVAAFCGISGSTKVGDFVMMGGRVGLKDNLTVGEGALLAAGAAVLDDVPAGETWGGYPAKSKRAWVRELAAVRRLAQTPKS